MSSVAARLKRAVKAARRRRAGASEPFIELIIFRCILSLALASVGAVLFLSIVSPSP